MNKRALGKGLGALFDLKPSQSEVIDSPEAVLNNELKKIDINKISPSNFQPRRVFNSEALLELAESIKANGVIQPIIVREKEDGYELVAGERRWRASKIAKLETIPAIVEQYTDAQMLEIALIENLQRQDLNPIEEAHAFRSLMKDFGLTQEEISQKIGRSRPAISNSVRLLNLNLEIQNYILQGTMTAGQAKPLLAIEDESLQMEIATEAILKDYSAREIEELVRSVLSRSQEILPQSFQKEGAEENSIEETTAEENENEKDKFYMNQYEDRLKLLLGTQVRIKPGKQKSKIEIEFYSSEDLERIMETLSSNTVESEKYISKFKGSLVV